MSQIRVPPKIIYNREDGIRDTFICQEKLGHGGFAVVYRVLHQSTSKVYAMKVISKNGSSSSRGKVFLEKLKNEIQIQKNLDHPNIVRSRLSFSDEFNYYIILEYCPGKSIRDYLRRSELRRLTEPETRRILNDVIQGLIYLHNHQIIHHDLKLENFLIGADGRVKIADFGISSILEDDDDKNYSISGTINYMSPEILQKENKGHSYEVDIWALGVSAFIMLTGRAPFDGLDRDIIYKNIRSADYRFPTGINLSYEAKDFIKTILRVDPRKRPTAIDLLTHPFLTKYDKELVQLYQSSSNTTSNNTNFNSAMPTPNFQGNNIGSCGTPNYQSPSPIRNFDLNLRRVSSPTRTANNNVGSLSARSYRESIRNYGSQFPEDPLSSVKKLNLNSNLQFSNENSNSNSNSSTRYRRVQSPVPSTNNNIGSYSARNYRDGAKNLSSQISDESFNSIKNLNLNANIPCSVPGSGINTDNYNVSSPTRYTKNKSTYNAYNHGSQISDDPLSPIKKSNFNSNVPRLGPGSLNFNDRNVSPQPIRTSKYGGSFSARSYKDSNIRNHSSQISDESLNSFKKSSYETNEMVPISISVSSSPIKSARSYRSSSARNYNDSNIRYTSSSSSRATSGKDEYGSGVKKSFSLPSHFVAKYCFHKNELGYLLGDGTVGVCFDDRSRIVIDPKESFVQYYKDYNSIPSVVDLDDSFDLAQQDDDSEILKDKIKTKILMVQKFAKSLKKSPSLFDYPLQDYTSTVPLKNVKYFLRKDDSILFRLNDKNIQVNFSDHKKLIIFYNSKKMCLVRNLKDKCALLDLKNTSNIDPNCEEFRKYRDAKDLLQTLAQKM